MMYRNNIATFSDFKLTHKDADAVIVTGHVSHIALGVCGAAYKLRNAPQWTEVVSKSDFVKVEIMKLKKGEHSFRLYFAQEGREPQFSEVKMIKI